MTDGRARIMFVHRLACAVAIASGALLLQGCLTSGSTPVNQGLSSIKLPQVSQSQIVHVVRFAPGGGFAAGEEAALAAFFRLTGIGYGDRLHLEDPAPEGAEGRYSAVATVAGRFGLPLQPRALAAAAAPLRAGEARLVVTRATAAVEGCPDWTRGHTPNWNNEASSNYGCATNSNLAAMLADKNDLLEGQELANQNAAAVAKPVSGYDAAAPAAFGAAGAWTGTGPAPTGGPR